MNIYEKIGFLYTFCDDNYCSLTECPLFGACPNGAFEALKNEELDKLIRLATENATVIEPDKAFEDDAAQEFKSDAGKPRLSLVPPEIMWAIGKVRTWAVENKYPDPNGWKNVSKERYKDALLRHTLAFVADEDSTDDESGFLHLWHIATNAAFLIALKGGDDDV